MIAAAGSPRVLYANQTTEISGGERSLLDLLGTVPRETVAAVACPAGGLRDAVKQRGLPVAELPATDVSFRLHPVHTTRGVAWVIGAGRRLRGIGRELAVDLVHANSTRAGLAAIVAARTGGPPAIVHVRDWVPEGRLPAMTVATVGSGADAIIANSGYVAAQFSKRRCPVHVVHNAVDVDRFDPERADREAARRELGLTPDDLVIAVIAQLTPWKGQDDAVRILGRLKPAKPRLRLLIVGSAKFTAASTRFDNAGFERSLRRLVSDLGLEREVVFAGERTDVPAMLAATDVLLVPSWQEAFGRIALEAMAMEVPVVATSAGGPAEFVREGVDGLLLAPKDPDAWAAALDPILDRPEVRREMGSRGRERAVAEFGLARHGERVMEVYREVIARGGGA